MDGELWIQVLGMVVSAGISAGLVGFYTLRAVAKTYYANVAEQIAIWKLEAYRKLVSAMDHGRKAAEVGNTKNLSDADRDCGHARQDLVLLISNECVNDSIQEFHKLLRDAKTMLDDKRPLTAEERNALRKSYDESVDAIRKELAAGPIGKLLGGLEVRKTD